MCASVYMFRHTMQNDIGGSFWTEKEEKVGCVFALVFDSRENVTVDFTKHIAFSTCAERQFNLFLNFISTDA